MKTPNKRALFYIKTLSLTPIMRGCQVENDRKRSILGGLDDEPAFEHLQFCIATFVF